MDKVKHQTPCSSRCFQVDVYNKKFVLLREITFGSHN
jgi:hypothetical protein